MMTNIPSPDQPCYYHLCSDGDLTPQFISNDDDYRVAFNLIGVCAANSDVVVLSFSIEDTHLHSLVFGTKTACTTFKLMYEESWAHHIGRTRGTRKGAEIDLEILYVDTEEYLLSVGTYTIVQPTKDGKQIMPYDYRWGTGSMYFRDSGHQSIWCRNESGEILKPTFVGDLSVRAQRVTLNTYRRVPARWKMCNGILLPENYIDVSHFERIYRTANCYRVFLSSNRSRDQIVMQKIAFARGISLDDAEARSKCHELMLTTYGYKDVRRLTPAQRIHLAQLLWKQFRLNKRQIASLVRLPYTEICKYL
ncbi:MAG: hypothetical protein IKX53_02040 [Bacteroidales bacterium]|nr:hypothetical protein [Bacteroidales bacterium]